MKNVNDLESANDLLLSERSQSVERDIPKCVSSKDGEKKNTKQHLATYFTYELGMSDLQVGEVM